jgi:putative peptidoglycan lipid II flippase
MIQARLASWSEREFAVGAGAALFLVTFLASAALGAVRQVLLSARFGAGDELSAYLAASRLPETLFTLVAGGALTNALVPVLIERIGAGDDAGAWRLAEGALSLLLAALTGLSVAAFLLAPVLVREVLAPGFDEPTAALATWLTRLLLVQPILLAVASVATASLSARLRFFLPAVTVLAHNIGEIGGVGASWLVPSLGILGPTFGVLAGVVLQIALMRSALRRNGVRMRWRWIPRDPGLRAMVRLLVPAGLSAGVTYATGIAEIAAASLAVEANAVPMVVNSWLLVGLPVRLIGAAAGQALFPRLAIAAEAGDWRQYRAQFWRTIGVVAVLTAPAIPAFLLFGDGVTRLLFARGAYTAADAELTARLAIGFALGLPFYAVSEVATRALVAVRDARSPLLVNIVQSGARIAMMLVLVDTAGVMVIAWSLAITASLECVALLVIVSRQLRWRLATGV